MSGVGGTERADDRGAPAAAGAPRSVTSPRVDLLGVGISDTNPADAVRTVEWWLEGGRKNYVCVTPVSGVMAAQEDPAALRAIDGAGLTVPDGMPLVWASRRAGARQAERVYGPDLMLALCELAAQRSWPCFFYGGKEGVADEVAAKLGSSYPGLPVAGTHCPPFRELTADEEDALTAQIDASGARIVWVGISTPKQDLWMARMVEGLRGPIVLIGVGAAFDVHAGLVKRPPDWLGPLGLFWLYRLAQEPRRLWRRYLVGNTKFVSGIIRRPPRLRT
jgi:N-acetylglucosaminyldiphosphoundecaprenol N-acetyl-beta-D-mannosaminyltransferase